MKRAGIQDVAREAGVSKTTVSNYLNGRDSRLSDETKGRIKAVIDRLHYSPSLGARRLSTKDRSYTIGILIRHDLEYAFNTLFFSRVMRGIGDVCDQYGYRAMIVSSQRNPRRDDTDYVLSLGRGIVDGFLIFDVEDHDAYIETFDKVGIPYLCFGRPDGEGYRNWVASDHRGGMVRAVNHLWDHGHRRIALFPGLPKLMVTRHRVDGYREALASRECEFDEALVHYNYSDRYDAAPALARLMDSPRRPTAFVIPQNLTSSFFAVAADRGLSVPQDAAVILSEYFAPNAYESVSYAHIKAPVYEVGVGGASKLVALIENEGYAPTPEEFPTELVTGRTCGCGTE